MWRAGHPFLLSWARRLPRPQLQLFSPWLIFCAKNKWLSIILPQARAAGSFFVRLPAVRYAKKAAKREERLAAAAERLRQRWQLRRRLRRRRRRLLYEFPCRTPKLDRLALNGDDGDRGWSRPERRPVRPI